MRSCLRPQALGWMSPPAVTSCPGPWWQTKHHNAEQSPHLPEICAFPWKGSLEISDKPVPADCATKENTDVIQWTMRNPNLAQWSFWLCFRFCSSAQHWLHSQGPCLQKPGAAREHILPLYKNISLLHGNEQTFAGWNPLTQHNYIKFEHVQQLCLFFWPLYAEIQPQTILKNTGLGHSTVTSKACGSWQAWGSLLHPLKF